MATRVIIGAEPAVLVHKGTINGELPKIGTAIAEALVSAGRAVWSGLSAGGVFAFNKRHLIVLGFSGGTPTIVSDSDYTTVSRALPSGLPFKLHPGEALKFASGSDVSVVVQEDITRIV
jgi:hypothetical protein